MKESLDVIKQSIEVGFTERQRSIGFHTSAAMCDILEIFLHKKSLIDPGASIKHDWFSSKRIANEHLPFDFPHKKEIIEIMVRIKSRRNALCYGKQHSESYIKETIDDFNSLKSKLLEDGPDE